MRALIWQAIGLVILILGNASRPYPAFGGEDLAYIAFSVIAVRELVVDGKEKRKNGTRIKRRRPANTQRERYLG